MINIENLGEGRSRTVTNGAGKRAILERGARTYRAVIDGDPEEARNRWPMLRDYFLGHDIYVEWCFPGLFSMAVPCDIGPDRLFDIVEACPVTIEGIAPPEEHDRFEAGSPAR